MVKRYIQSFISMKYVLVLPMLALMVFVSAFLYTMSGKEVFRLIGLLFGVILAVVMFFYYREKIRASRSLKRVENLSDYSDAIMIGQAFFLEDRMLGYHKGMVRELHYPEVTNISFTELNGGKLFLNLDTAGGVLPVEMSIKDQARRVAEFLVVRSPDAKVEGIDPYGEGTLHSIDPYRNESGDTKR
ncbi:MAG: hypothetical protein IJ225_03345 [Solobacterium sp.]|nr:hypothetical protein [Solobacterium sp.]